MAWAQTEQSRVLAAPAYVVFDILGYKWLCTRIYWGHPLVGTRDEILVKADKAKRLRADGWQVGDADEFLGLTPEESQLVEFKLALAARVRVLRANRGWTQVQLATALGSSQSRMAKLEAADPSVSTDLMLKALFSLGGELGSLPKTRAGRSRKRAARPDSPAES